MSYIQGTIILDSCIQAQRYMIDCCACGKLRVYLEVAVPVGAVVHTRDEDHLEYYKTCTVLLHQGQTTGVP